MSGPVGLSFHRRAAGARQARWALMGPSGGRAPGGDAARRHGSRGSRGLALLRLPAVFKLKASEARVPCASRGQPHAY